MLWYWLVFSLILLAAPTKAVPVVPNFQQGVLSSSTTTKTKVTEVITLTSTGLVTSTAQAEQT